MSLTGTELRARIEVIGVVEVGRRYALRTMEQLDAMYETGEAELEGSPDDDDGWIDSVGFDGDQLSDDEFFAMILAALDAAAEHRGALWCIADGPMDHLVGRDRSFALRFHRARRDHASVASAFAAMHEDLDACGLGHGWWDDAFPDQEPRWRD